MHRVNFGIAMITAVMSFSTFVCQPVMAQRIVDPSPVAEDEAVEMELPAPQSTSDTSNSSQDQSVDIRDTAPAPARDSSRPFFGVTFDPRVQNAAVARSVAAGSPADEAGVQAGDTIVGLNGQAMNSYDDVLRTIGMLKPGEVLDVEISRRVSVRARAVLDGQPKGPEQTTTYRAEPEYLPAPAGAATQPATSPSQRPLLQPPRNSIPLPPRAGAEPNRNNTRANDLQRNQRGRDSQEDNRSRGRFLRRR